MSDAPVPIPPGYTISVAAIIHDGHGRALLVQRRDNGQWEPPGGALNPGESLEDGVYREVREETCLRIHLGPLTGVYFNTAIGVAAHVYLATIAEGTPTPTDEGAAFTWADESQIRQLVSSVYAIRYLDALTYHGTPAIRWHNGHALLPSKHTRHSKPQHTPNANPGAAANL